MDEKKIASLMKSLGCTREEAIAVIEEDEAIDKMTMKEINADLTPEQRKVMKEATSTGTKKRTAVKRERKPDDTKREIIETVARNLDRCCFGEDLHTVANVTIANPEREITFSVDGAEYSITLTKHRPPKQ